MGLFNRSRNPKPPYDTLTAEQRYALYYQLEYLTMKGVPMQEMSWAFSYLEKAAIAFGMTKKQMQRLYHISNKSQTGRFLNI